MKFKLATILWAITAICLIVGWLWERRSYHQMIHQQLDAEVRVECAISSALRRNIFTANYHDLKCGEKSQEEFDAFKNRQLVEGLIELFRNEGIARQGVFPLSNGTFRAAQSDRLLDSAGLALSLLGFSSAEDLNTYFLKEEQYAEYFGAELFDKEDEINEQFKDFVKRAIDYQISTTAGTD